MAITLRPLPSRSSVRRRLPTADDVALWGFIALVLLGMIAVGVSFARM